MRGERKNLLTGLTLDDASGEVEAVVATLGVTDRHGDVLEAGFAGEQTVRMIWDHDWATPIGKGRVYEDGDKLRFAGKMFVDIPSVREKYDLMKAMDDLQEWSWGFFIKDGATSKDGQTRRIKAMPDGSPGVEIFEVSPVLVGAGVGTGTVAMKTSQPKRLHTELDDAAHVLTSAVERVAEVVALRAQKDRTLGADTQLALDVLRSAVDDAHRALADLDPAPTPTEADGELAARWRDLYREQLRQQLRAQGIPA